MSVSSEDSSHNYFGNREGNAFSSDESVSAIFSDEAEVAPLRLVLPISAIPLGVTKVGPSRRAIFVESGFVEELFGDEGEEEGGEGEEEKERGRGEYEGEHEEASTSEPAGPSRIRYAPPQKLTRKPADMCSDGKVNVAPAS